MPWTNLSSTTENWAMLKAGGYASYDLGIGLILRVNDQLPQRVSDTDPLYIVDAAEGT